MALTVRQSRRQENVALGPLFGLAAFPPRRALDVAAQENRIILFAARQQPAPLEKPQGRRAGPALRRPRGRIGLELILPPLPSRGEGANGVTVKG